MKKWKDNADHKAGCPYKGVAVYGTAEEMAKYHSGYCPGCNRPVKWRGRSVQAVTTLAGRRSSMTVVN